MKNTLTLAFVLLSCGAFAQSTWNQQLPLFNSFIFPYQDASYENGRILVCGREQIVEFDQLGTCTGKASLSSDILFSNFVRRKVDPSTGALFFLSGMRRITGTTGYSLQIFKPNEGISASIELPDSLGTTNLLGGAITELDDSTVVVFGRKFAYKVRANGSSAFTQIWQQPISFQTNTACNAAVITNNGFLALSIDGSILGFDNNGQQLFFKTLPFSFYGATALPDGIIACGTNTDQKAVLTKLTFDGDVVWSQVYDDKRYNHVAATLDGGLVATGTTASSEIALLKTNGNGQPIWSKTYQKGTGTKVVAMPDGGYFLISFTSSPSAVYGIKTDGSGATAPLIDEFFAQNRQLKNDGVKATFEPTASLFFSGTDGTLISPANGEASSIFTFSPQIGGFDSNGLLHLAAEDYSPGYGDFHTGPLGGHNGDYNRVWLAKKSEIMAMRRDFLIDQTLNAAVPYDLLTWPAKGNQQNEYNIDFTKIKTNPMLQSAPFVDLNGDGKYNVFDGDYPRIKGDQMAWWMMNDDSIHLNSYARPMKIDLAISAYLYDCPQNESVKNSLFVDFECINRSALLYDSCYLGFFTDFDLGCLYDDYFGSMPDANSYYVYNQNAEDLDCQSGQSFGAEVPVQTVTFQDRSLDHFIYGNNSIGGSNMPPYINPSAPFEFYNYLQGNLSNGTRPTMGGTGYNPSSTDYVDHVFPANPADPNGWSMCVENLPTSDRVAMGSHGPFTFAPNDTFKISVAFTTHNNIPLPCPDVFGLVKPAIQQLTTWSNEGVLETSPNLGVVQEILGNPLTLGMNIPGAMFQWSTGETSPTISVSAPGEYSVTVTSPAGCQTVETVLVKLGASTGGPQQKANWSMFPNPATDFIQVACSECGQGEGLQVVLRNTQGAVVRRETATSSTFSVQLQGLPSGLYWLELWQGGAYLGSKKFVHVIQ